ncbi:serine hydrolase domain-containing protein [Cellulosimicrobium cellulans]|uniref:serine hydrolase domain-containing protein n=1 Tax=Cellulosimicrobium cellulans TaxID=1710 RepID=UPI0036E86601
MTEHPVTETATAFPTEPAAPAPSPEAHGIPSAAVLDLLDALEDGGLDPHGLVVARGGVPVVEASWAPHDAPLPGLVYSVSKTFTALAVGHLVAEGHLAVDDLVGELLGLRDPTGLTVRHLLTMNTGHTSGQLAEIGFDLPRLLATPPEHAPGTHFAYSSPASRALSSVVTAVTGGRLLAYLRPRVLDPLGVAHPWWVEIDGLDQGFSGLHVTTAEMARLAVAMADGGRYAGVTVIPPAWLAAMREPWSDTAEHGGAPGVAGGEPPDWSRGYGYQVWTSRHGFRADGAYGQFAIAVPERGLAIGYRGATRDAQSTLDAIWAFVERAGDGSTPLPPDPAAAARLADRLAMLDAWPGILGQEPDPEPTPQDVISPVPWTLHAVRAGSPYTWRLDVGGQPVPVAEDRWTTRVLPWPHAAEGSGAAAGPVLDPELVVSTRGRARPDGEVEVHVVLPTSPHRLVATGRPDEHLTLAWHTTPLWHPSLSTLVVPAAHAATLL